MNLPNLISVTRVLLVPVVIWLIGSGAYSFAFLVFLLASVSDAADGYIARRFNMRTELGAYLDPIADKALLVSIYVTLGVVNGIPSWLAIAVVSRDVMIVGAVLLAWVLGRPLAIAPLFISKANTLGQILLAGLALASHGFALDLGHIIRPACFAVGALTIASAAAYLAVWMRHMAGAEAVR